MIFNTGFIPICRHTIEAQGLRQRLAAVCEHLSHRKGAFKKNGDVWSPTDFAYQKEADTELRINLWHREANAIPESDRYLKSLFNHKSAAFSSRLIATKSNEELLELWDSMEKLSRENRADHLGISGISIDQLEYLWAQGKRIQLYHFNKQALEEIFGKTEETKPDHCRICCIPADLRAKAALHKTQLIDQSITPISEDDDLLDEKSTKVIQNLVGRGSTEVHRASWILGYTVWRPLWSVTVAEGYMFKLEKKEK